MYLYIQLFLVMFGFFFKKLYTPQISRLSDFEKTHPPPISEGFVILKIQKTGVG